MTPQEFSESSPPRTIQVREFFIAQRAFLSVPVFHITDRVTKVERHGLPLDTDIFRITYASNRTPGFVDGGTLLYVTYPWSSDDYTPLRPDVNNYVDLSSRVIALCNKHSTRLLAQLDVFFHSEGDGTLSCAECTTEINSSLRAYAVNQTTHYVVLTLPVKRGNARKRPSHENN